MSDFPGHGQPPPLVRQPGRLSNALLVIYVAVFLLERFFVNSASSAHFVSSTFALSLGGLKEGYLWQLLTYQFMHGGDLHLVMNCMGLYFIGPTVEILLGRARFLALYFGGGIAGGLLQLFMGLVQGGPDVAMVGASGGLMALLGVVACQFWRQRLRLMIMFILPVSVTGRGMLILLTAVDLAGAFFHDSVIAHYAHLGGLYAGFWGMKFLQKRLVA